MSGNINWHSFDPMTEHCTHCQISRQAAMDLPNFDCMRAYEIKFCLGRALPSAEHTFTVNAGSPMAAIEALYQAWPGAMMPITIGYASGQGDGHKPMAGGAA